VRLVQPRVDDGRDPPRRAVESTDAPAELREVDVSLRVERERRDLGEARRERRDAAARVDATDAGLVARDCEAAARVDRDLDRETDRRDASEPAPAQAEHAVRDVPEEQRPVPRDRDVRRPAELRLRGRGAGDERRSGHEREQLHRSSSDSAISIAFSFGTSASSR
jgi:hypothetical protein